VCVAETRRWLFANGTGKFAPLRQDGPVVAAVLSRGIVIKQGSAPRLVPAERRTSPHST
jgi:hypothetical protein